MSEVVLTAAGQTRICTHRTENHDAFRICPELGLVMVVDGFESAAAAPLVLDVFERLVRAAVDTPRAEVMAAAAYAADLALRALPFTTHRPGAEVAAVWIRGLEVELIAIGNCRVYHARGTKLEVVTDATWSSSPLGSGDLELVQRVFTVAPDDSLVLSTDGFHRLGDQHPATVRVDPGGYFARTPVPQLLAELISAAEPTDDATVVAVRFELPDLTVGLEPRIVEALARFCTTDASALRLRTVVLRSPRRPPGTTRGRRLQLELIADPRPGESAAAAAAARFSSSLMTTDPELGGPHDWTVVPALVETEASISQRTQRIREVAATVLSRHRGLYLGPITPRASWSATAHLDILVIRDDVDRAGDEDLAARQLANALRTLDPTLAASATVRGEYCK